MATTVVNVRVKYIRPLGYHNLCEWTKNPDNVYIGRKRIVFIENRRFPDVDSIFANPFKIGRDGTREAVIDKYEKYITDRLAEPSMAQALEDLRGKTLGCWCCPEPCHGDVLIKLLSV